VLGLLKTLVDPSALDERKQNNERNKRIIDEHYRTTVNNKLKGCVDEDQIESGRNWISSKSVRSLISHETYLILMGTLQYQYDMLPSEDEKPISILPHIRKRNEMLKLGIRKSNVKLLRKKDLGQ
jgi:hypothetical protein